nr:class I SAM-dependent methyltransferase [Microbacterium sp. CPCC 204701]
MLELGPGTGQFTIAVAPYVGRVIAADASPPMLRLLARKTAGLRNVVIVEAGFLGYDGADASVDIIYSRFALHHLPDVWKAVALQRMRRLLRPGGLLRLWDVVYDFPLAEATDRLEAWCATRGDAVDREWSHAELEEARLDVTGSARDRCRTAGVAGRRARRSPSSRR